MTITQAQRISIQKLWQRVCKDRSWKVADRDLRLAKFGEILGRPLKSSSDIGRIDECTKLMAELKAMLGVDLRAGQEAEDQTINRARVLRHQIVNELVPCLELYVQDVRAYMAGIMADKNRWWKIDRPAREIELSDLDAKPIFRTDRATGELKQWPSQLEQLQYTLSRCLNEKRNAAGHSIHDMRTKAGLSCACGACRRVRISEPAVVHVEEPQAVTQPVLAGNSYDENVEPF
jgi:hypothetical protein